ncbi:MAG: 50S ribosomal protein L11 methyltransferase [Candidatus Thorarchaeota archaeon]
MAKHEYATPFSMLHAASLLNHKSRIRKYAEAIKQVVNSESYVVDIGAGSGILSLLSARAGARKVTAVEINSASIGYAKHSARLNKLEDRIEFFNGHYLDFVPSEKADVVVCEMLSSMMLVEQQITAANHAIKKILKPGGIILPQSISVYCVLVQCDHLWDQFTVEGFVFPKVPQTVFSEDTKDLSAMTLLESFDFSKGISKTEVDVTLDIEIVQDGTLHGIVGMFDSYMIGDITLKMEDGWRELFVPLEEAVKVTKKDKISLRVKFIPGKADSILVEVDSHNTL